MCKTDCILASNSRQKDENYTAREVKEEQKIHRRGDNTQKYENVGW
jgi:hypothetical protein